MQSAFDMYFHSLRGLNILVMGLGVSNRPLVRLLLSYGCTVTGCDRTPREKLDAEVLGTYYKNIIRLAERFQTLCGGLEFVNMGSGMGVPYAADDRKLDIKALGKSVEEALGSFRARYPDTKILLETGRYAVCRSGFYITKVIDRKESYGKTYLIL